MLNGEFDIRKDTEDVAKYPDKCWISGSQVRCLANICGKNDFLNLFCLILFCIKNLTAEAKLFSVSI